MYLISANASVHTRGRPQDAQQSALSDDSLRCHGLRHPRESRCVGAEDVVVGLDGHGLPGKRPPRPRLQGVRRSGADLRRRDTPDHRGRLLLRTRFRRPRASGSGTVGLLGAGGPGRVDPAAPRTLTADPPRVRGPIHQVGSGRSSRLEELQPAPRFQTDRYFHGRTASALKPSASRRRVRLGSPAWLARSLRLPAEVAYSTLWSTVKIMLRTGANEVGVSGLPVPVQNSARPSPLVSAMTGRNWSGRPSKRAGPAAAATAGAVSANQTRNRSAASR